MLAQEVAHPVAHEGAMDGISAIADMIATAFLIWMNEICADDSLLSLGHIDTVPLLAPISDRRFFIPISGKGIGLACTDDGTQYLPEERKVSEVVYLADSDW
jgi:hypothetical protein